MTIIPSDVFCANSINYLIFKESDPELYFPLGILNSRVLNFVFSRFSTNSNVNGYEVDNLPLPIKPDANSQTIVSSTVNEILKLKAINERADTAQLEHQIDQVVYQLYGMTKKEIAVVEGATGGSSF
jgi:hypothetical protein